jgi:hypothetical protein
MKNISSKIEKKYTGYVFISIEFDKGTLICKKKAYTVGRPEIIVDIKVIVYT